jgi:hypothetical protein
MIVFVMRIVVAMTMAMRRRAMHLIMLVTREHQG